MASRPVLTVALIALFFASGGVAAICDDPSATIATAIREKRLKKLFTDFGITPETQHVYFVAIDHRSAGDITAYDWTTSGRRGLDVTKAKPEDLKPKIMTRSADDGVPELPIGRNERIITVLTRTNPPLYTLSKATTFANVPGLEDLSKIVNAFGQFVSASASRGLKTSLASVTEQDELKDLTSTITDAYAVTRAVTDDRDFTVRFLQYSEEGAQAPALPDPFPNEKTTVAKVSEVFTALRKGRNDFATKSGALYGCKDLRDLAQRALEALKTPDTADKEIARLGIAIDATSCSDAGKTRLKDILNGKLANSTASTTPASDVAASLGSSSPSATTGAQNKPDTKKGDASKIDDPRKGALEVFIDMSDAVMSMMKTADDLLATELVTMQTVTQIQLLKADPHSFDTCTYTEGVIFADSPDKVAFDKVGTVKVTIAEASPLGATYHRRANGAGDRSYRTANPIARNISIGVGGIYTPLREPTYTAVTDPTNSSQKVIAKTAEKKRAGAVALLGNYLFGTDRAFFRPGIQVGTGFGSDPQVFAGFSADLGSILRLGVGVTGQQVKGLASGQTPLAFGADGKPLPGATVVSSNDDIRTKQRLKGAPYISLTLSLDSLSLFKRP